MAQSVLTQPGMSEALEGKLLISILAGVTISQLEALVEDPTDKNLETLQKQLKMAEDFEEKVNNALDINEKIEQKIE